MTDEVRKSLVQLGEQCCTITNSLPRVKASFVLFGKVSEILPRANREVVGRVKSCLKAIITPNRRDGVVV